MMIRYYTQFLAILHLFFKTIKTFIIMENRSIDLHRKIKYGSSKFSELFFLPYGYFHFLQKCKGKKNFFLIFGFNGDISIGKSRWNTPVYESILLKKIQHILFIYLSK